jgi:hypothetical protein
MKEVYILVIEDGEATSMHVTQYRKNELPIKEDMAEHEWKWHIVYLYDRFFK